MTPEIGLTILYIACSVVIWISVRALVRDKMIRGVSIIPAWVFLATNLYEVWFFGGLEQFVARIGSGLMATGNLVWLVLAYYYMWSERADAQIDKTLDFQR